MSMNQYGYAEADCMAGSQTSPPQSIISSLSDMASFGQIDPVGDQPVVSGLFLKHQIGRLYGAIGPDEVQSSADVHHRT